MSLIEVGAALATLINVYLTARNNIWCWIWGIASVLLYGYVFYTRRLYSSAGLQILFYLPMQFYGWWVWLRWGPTHNDDLPVARLTLIARVCWIGANLPIAIGLGFLMTYTGARLTYADALVSAMSVTAQILLTFKYIENWWLWIAVNSIYAFYLLPKQELYASTGLYSVLLFMAIYGLAEWNRIMRKQPVPASESPSERSEAAL